MYLFSVVFGLVVCLVVGLLLVVCLLDGSFRAEREWEFCLCVVGLDERAYLFSKILLLALCRGEAAAFFLTTATFKGESAAFFLTTATFAACCVLVFPALFGASSSSLSSELIVKTSTLPFPILDLARCFLDTLLLTFM